MGDIIEFKDKSMKYVTFDEFIDGDFYLKLTSINALTELQYPCNEEGVKQFQSDNNLPADGILKLEDLGILMQIFDADHFQEILNHIETRSEIMEDCMKDKKDNHESEKILALLIAVAFFSIWGFIDCWLLVYHFIIGLFS